MEHANSTNQDSHKDLQYLKHKILIITPDTIATINVQ